MTNRDSGQGAGGAVLVVDDHVLLRAHLRVMLEAAGYSVNVAADGETALEWVAHSRPDLIVLDLRMPGLDGWGMLQRLRADPANDAIRVLIASAAPRGEAPDRSAGVSGFVAKPIEAGQLLQAVALALA